MSARLYCPAHHAYDGRNDMPDPECVPCVYLRTAVRSGHAALAVVSLPNAVTLRVTS